MLYVMTYCHLPFGQSKVKGKTGKTSNVILVKLLSGLQLYFSLYQTLLRQTPYFGNLARQQDLAQSLKSHYPQLN